jgi:lysophospholipase L1-like esterase
VDAIGLASRPGTTLVAPLAASDPDGDRLTVTVTGADDLHVRRSDGGWELHWTPATTGAWEGRVEVRDHDGATTSAAIQLRATNPPSVGTLMALGDSVASGHGLSKRDYLQGDDCWRAGDEAYPRLVHDELVARGVLVGGNGYFNVACSGATLADLLRTRVGGGPSGLPGGDRAQADWAVAVNPELITVTAGANTLGFVHPERLIDGQQVDRAELAERLAAVADRLERLLARLVDHTDATVLLTNYYNPAGPRAQGVEGCREQCFHVLAEDVVAELNATISRVAADFPPDRVTVIDLASRFAGHWAPNGLGPDGLRACAVGWIKDLIGAPVAGVHPYCASGHDDAGSWVNYVDCVHPDGRGHAEIAAAIVDALDHAA